MRDADSAQLVAPPLANQLASTIAQSANGNVPISTRAAAA